MQKAKRHSARTHGLENVQKPFAAVFFMASPFFAGGSTEDAIVTGGAMSMENAGYAVTVRANDEGREPPRGFFWTSADPVFVGSVACANSAGLMAKPSHPLPVLILPSRKRAARIPAQSRFRVTSATLRLLCTCQGQGRELPCPIAPTFLFCPARPGCTPCKETRHRAAGGLVSSVFSIGFSFRFSRRRSIVSTLVSGSLSERLMIP